MPEFKPIVFVGLVVSFLMLGIGTRQSDSKERNFPIENEEKFNRLSNPEKIEMLYKEILFLKSALGDSANRR